MRTNARKRAGPGPIRWLALIAAASLAGCATAPLPPPPVPAPPEPVGLPEESAYVPAEPGGAEDPLEVVPQEQPPVAIVMTSRDPAYEDVVVELGRLLEKTLIYDLSDKSQPPVSAFRLINDSKTATVVAIGLRAARSAVAMAGVPVVFSQVFNHQDHGLVGESSRGVAAIAPIDAQLAAWKELDPAVSEIGIIIGEGHDELLASAEIAAERHGLKLRVRIAHSDQETLYFFKRMIPEIDGFWLLPDNRILSARVLQQMLAEANRRNVAVVVPNDELLGMGAAISLSTVPADIAATIAGIVRRIQSGGLEDLPPLTPLSAIRVATNDAVLQKRMLARETPAGRGTRQ